MVAVFAFPLTPSRNVAIVARDGWDLLVSCHAPMVNRFLWTVVVVYVMTVILDFIAILCAPAEVCASPFLVLINLNATVVCLEMAGGDLCVMNAAVPASVLIALGMVYATWLLKNAIVLLVGLGMDVRFQFALVPLNVLVEASAMVHLILHCAQVAKTIGWVLFAIFPV